MMGNNLIEPLIKNIFEIKCVLDLILTSDGQQADRPIFQFRLVENAFESRQVKVQLFLIVQCYDCEWVAFQRHDLKSLLLNINSLPRTQLSIQVSDRGFEKEKFLILTKPRQALVMIWSDIIDEVTTVDKTRIKDQLVHEKEFSLLLQIREIKLKLHI